MATNSYLSSDYITRRGVEETTNGFKNNNNDQGRIERSSIVGQTGLTKTYMSSFGYNYAKQFFENKGIEEPVARSLILIANDIATLHEKPIQMVLEEMENDGKKIVKNPRYVAEARAKLSGDTIYQITFLNHALGYYTDFIVQSCTASNSDTITTTSNFKDVKLGYIISDKDSNVLGKVIDVISETQIQIDATVTLTSERIIVRPIPTLTITGDGVGASAICSIDDNGMMSVDPLDLVGGSNYSEATVSVEPSSVLRQDAITITAHGYKTGDRIYFKANKKTTTQSSLSVELDEVDYLGKIVSYYVIAQDLNTIKIATTEKNARLNINIELSQPELEGGFTIYRYFDMRLGVDSYLYMNSIRPTSNQMMAMEQVKVEDSLRNYRIQP